MKYARAYRTGGFSQFDQQLFEFSPEHVGAYEIGLKATGLDNRARFNINAFYEDYADIQVATIVVVPSCPFGCAGTQNGGSAQFNGVEGEFELVPMAGLRLRGDYAYLDTNGSILFPNAPRWSYNADAEYSFPPFRFGALSAVVNYSYNGRQISSTTGETPFFNEDSRIVNARVSLSDIPVGSGQASISLWGNNLTDEEYTVYANSGALIYGTPRTYGVNVSFQL